MRLFVTGGTGLIGSNFARFLLRSRKDVELFNFDKLTYAGNPESLRDLAEDPRYHFVLGDVTDRKGVERIFWHGFTALVHFAAETHVDRSIEDVSPFLRTNVMGTHCLLDAALHFRLPRFIHISMDEIYGSAPAGASFTEGPPLDPLSPYAASKASADHLLSAYFNTFGLPAVILRCTNSFGPFQFPEKLIPLIIANARRDKRVLIYGDGLQERDSLFVEDLCHAIALVLDNAEPGSVYNVSAGTPQPNLSLVRTILQNLGKPESLVQFVQDCPGHDRRYALDSSEIQRELGWSPKVSFEGGIRRTIEWYQANPPWLDHALSGEYRNFYHRNYTCRSKTFRT